MQGLVQGYKPLSGYDFQLGFLPQRVLFLLVKGPLLPVVISFGAGDLICPVPVEDFACHFPGCQFPLVRSSDSQCPGDSVGGGWRFSESPKFKVTAPC